MEHFKKIYEAINNGNSEPHTPPKGLSGFSGEKLLSALVNLSSYNLSEEKVYLKLGVYQGMSLLSIAHGVKDNTQIFGIDNFASFDEDGENESIVNSRIEKLGLRNVHLINLDYEEALRDLKKIIGDKKIGVCFVDGPHYYRSQLICLLLIQPYLSDDAIIIVDDCNYRHVRLANRNFLLTNPSFKLFFEAYTKSHPQNMPPSEEAFARKVWWNGVNILTYDKHNQQKATYPETFKSRVLYENKHIMHSGKSPTLPIKLSKYTRHTGDLLSKFKNKSDIQKGTYNSLNTYSENLPNFHFTQNLIHNKLPIN